MSFGFFIRESLRSMRRNAVPSFAAFASVLVTVLVIGGFIPVVQLATGAANDVSSKVLVGVYLKTTAGPTDIARIGNRLRHDTPDVKSVQFVSKQTALAEQTKADPEAYALITQNPLPDSFRVTPDKPGDVNVVSNALLSNGGGGPPIDPAIATVDNRRADAQKILTATSLVKLTMGVLAALLIAASILLVSNTIRLSLFARRREVEVMKLVGATDGFIRLPFIIEGMLLGLMGGVAALALLVIAKLTVIDSLVSNFGVLWGSKTIDFKLLALILIASAVGVSATGSALSLRRFLRV